MSPNSIFENSNLDFEKDLLNLSPSLKVLDFEQIKKYWKISKYLMKEYNQKMDLNLNCSIKVKKLLRNKLLFDLRRLIDILQEIV